MQDSDGMTVGMLSGSSQNRTLVSFAEENGFTYQVREYEDPRELAAALQEGTIDAILTSNLRRAENERLLDTIKIDYFYAITRKEDQELLDEINYAINQMNLYEGAWANALYNKYYRNYESDTSSTSDFTQRELDYIESVVSGEKRITVTAMPDRKPYSYAEDEELKGIQPRFFDSLMQIAGLPYDLILLDWKMPEPNGLETARLIRKDNKTPILLLTSYDWSEIKQEALEIGVNHFMPKPFFMSTFKEAVRLMMGRAKETKHQEADMVKGLHILVVDDVRDAIDSGMDAHIAKPIQINKLKSTIQQVLDSRAAAENL